MELIIREKFDGKLKSVRLLLDGEKNPSMSTGMFLPGTYDLGKHSRKELIQVTAGAIVINGKLYSEGDGTVCTVLPGENVVFDVREHSAYLSRFPKE